MNQNVRQHYKFTVNLKTQIKTSNVITESSDTAVTSPVVDRNQTLLLELTFFVTTIWMTANLNNSGHFFFICIYYFQPMFYRLGMSRGIYSVFSFTHLHYICSFLAALFVWSYFVVFDFPGAHLEVVWRWFLGSLWCRRCLYGTEETAAVG